MVAPLIKATKIVLATGKTGIKTKSRTSKAKKRTNIAGRRYQRLVSKQQTDDRRHRQEPVYPQNNSRHRPNSNTVTKKTVMNAAGSIKKTVKSAIRGGVIAYTLVWFYPIQLFFAFVFIMSVSEVGRDGTRGWLVGDTAMSIMMLSWVVLIFIGTAFMIYAAAMFKISGISLNKTSIFLMFIIAIWGYWSPYLFFFPWVFLWIAVVVYSQK